MPMNKRCTDSSCRRTFSTLDFDGRCPYCGKAYPQLGRARHRMPKKAPSAAPKRKRIAGLNVKTGRRVFRLRISLGEVLKYIDSGKTDKAAVAFRKAVGRRGFSVSPDAAGGFCRDIMEGKPLCTAWVPPDDKGRHRRRIMPAPAGPVQPEAEETAECASPDEFFGPLDLDELDDLDDWMLFEEDL